MRIATCLIAAAVATGLAGPAGAEMIVVGSHIEVKKPAAAPTRGMTMREVLRRFGVPQAKLPPVGKPPITRWRYPGFTVYFEYHYVIDSVATG